MKGSSRCHVPLIKAFFPELSLDFDNTLSDYFWFVLLRQCTLYSIVYVAQVSSGLLQSYTRTVAAFVTP
jgi:hypothetical protein